MEYGAAKAALSNFCKALSKEVGKHDIRVNTVSPGAVATDLWLGRAGIAESIAHVAGLQAAAVAQQAAKGSVTARFTRPEEVADLVLLLACDRAGNLDGIDVVIEGGTLTTI